MARSFWVGRWLFHSQWSHNGVWTATKGQEKYNFWLYFGPLDGPEGRAWMLFVWRWRLMFARKPEEQER